MSDSRYHKTGDIIDCTMEECAELIHILCKVKRFGWFNYHPDDPQKTPNLILVNLEISDIKQRLTELKKEMTHQQERQNHLRDNPE